MLTATPGVKWAKIGRGVENPGKFIFLVDLLEGDVLAADLGHQFDRSAVFDEPLGVDSDQILAVRPAVRIDHARGLLRLVPIADHDVAADPGLANLAGPNVQLRLGVLDHVGGQAEARKDDFRIDAVQRHVLQPPLDLAVAAPVRAAERFAVGAPLRCAAMQRRLVEHLVAGERDDELVTYLRPQTELVAARPAGPRRKGLTARQSARPR
jgi:hypothetical protein